MPAHEEHTDPSSSDDEVLRDPGSGYSGSDDTDSDAWSNPLDHLQQQPVLPAEMDLQEQAGPSLSVVVVAVLDWMTKHKATEVSTKDLCSMVPMICPGAATHIYQTAASALQCFMHRRVLKIDVCICGHTAYFDAVSPQLSHVVYSSLDTCPRCGEPRYFTDEDGALKARAVFYYMPVKGWLTDLYARVDLVPFLRNDLPPESFPPGHMRRSNGWKYKVTENPNINTDGRHLAVTGACDGVPLFKDKNALSGWPFLLRPCIADGLSTEPAYSHLVAYQTCVYQDEVAGKIVSVSRYICVSHVANTCFITNNC